MTDNLQKLAEREKSIRAKINTLEGLHKACQLSAIGLAEPILNESRYLARALADVLYFDKGTPEYMAALQNAEHAARCAINDAVDILLTYVKAGIARIQHDYTTFDLPTSEFGEDFVRALRAMERVGAKVVSSRRAREDRDAIYQQLAEQKEDLACLSEFALLMPRMEAVAQRVHLDKAGSTSGEKNPGSRWLADQMAAGLSAGSEDVRFSLVIQPKYELSDTGDAACIGAEALTRLHVRGSEISPGRFIPLAEATGQIREIGTFALRNTLRVLKEHPEIPSVSVNVSPVELLDTEYADRVLDLIAAELGGACGRLELEITENAAINDLESFRHLSKLADAGVRIAIDDFGTGLTRFDYLAKVRISVLKIDQTLVRAYNRAPDTYGMLLRAIMGVGDICGMHVVAEGVETLEDVQNLHRHIGLTKFQGWHFGRPVLPMQFFQDHTNFRS